MFWVSVDRRLHFGPCGSSCDEDVRVQGGTSISPGDKYLTATEKDKRLVRYELSRKL